MRWFLTLIFTNKTNDVGKGIGIALNEAQVGSIGS